MPIANTLHEGGYRLPCTILIGPGRPIRAVNGTLDVVEKWFICKPARCAAMD